MSDTMLSMRSSVYLGEHEFLVKCFIRCLVDPTIINMGTAVNALCEDIIQERFKKDDLFTHEPAWQHYMGLNGTPDLLKITATFLTERLGKGVEISPGNLRTTNGASAGLEALAFILSDPEDVILIPTPTYGRFFADMNERFKTKVVGFHLEENDKSKFCLTAELLEKKIIQEKNSGRSVKAFMYCNPHNPLGIIYPKDLTIRLMEVCKRHEVHFISDEIYGLSVFDPSSSFDSVLSIPRDELPDPERTHFMWGLSKDFGLAGFRLGFIHSYNRSLVQCLDGMSIFVSSSVHIQQVAAKLLSDKSWLDNIYFPTNLERLEKTFQLVNSRLSSLSVPVIRTQAGLFCWADFSLYLGTKDEAGEMELFEELMETAKVYIVPGSQFDCKIPGWFRIIFAVRSDVLDDGLDRIESVLKAKNICIM